MKRPGPRWNALVLLLALTTMVGCQGFSAGSSSSSQQPQQPESGTANLTLGASTLGFGTVVLDSSETKSATLTNSGSADVTVSEATVSGNGFSLGEMTFPLTLGAGKSTKINVVFSPQSAAPASGKVAIVSDASDSTLNLQLSGVGQGLGSVAINPTTVVFGGVLEGSNQTLPAAITNSGSTNVTVSQATLTGAGFSVTGLTIPLTLTAGQSANFSVVFAPQSAGAANGNIAFTNDGSTPTVNLPLSGTGLALGSLSATPPSVGFGNVIVGTPKTLPATVTNTSGSSVTITQANATGSGVSVTGLSLPLTLTAGQGANFSVVFAPQTAGTVTGSVAVISNASNPTLTIPVTGTAVLPGTLSPNPPSLGFGNVQVGTNGTLSETVTNSGGSDATITQDTVTGAGFSVTGLNPPLTLTSGQSVTFSVVFTPLSGGGSNGNLAITSDASNPTLNIPLSGIGTAQGTLAVSPTTLNFHNVVVGTNSALPASLIASGSAVQVTAVNVSSAEFVVSGLTLPVTIPAGNSVGFTVTFTPQSNGQASGNATFTSNASNSPVLALVGTGTAPPVHSVLLSWTASNSPNISGYNIYRGPATGGPWTKINNSLDTTTTYTDNNVTDGQTYYYVATAVNSNDQESAHSAPPAQAIIPPI